MKSAMLYRSSRRTTKAATTAARRWRIEGRESDDDDDDDATTARVWGDPVWASLTTTRPRELFDGTAPSVLLSLILIPIGNFLYRFQ
jgi:hypothetical protein